MGARCVRGVHVRSQAPLDSWRHVRGLRGSHRMMRWAWLLWSTTHMPCWAETGLQSVRDRWATQTPTGSTTCRVPLGPSRTKTDRAHAEYAVAATCPTRPTPSTPSTDLGVGGVHRPRRPASQKTPAVSADRAYQIRCGRPKHFPSPRWQEQAPCRAAGTGRARHRFARPWKCATWQTS